MAVHKYYARLPDGSIVTQMTERKYSHLIAVIDRKETIADEITMEKGWISSLKRSSMSEEGREILIKSSEEHLAKAEARVPIWTPFTWAGRPDVAERKFRHAQMKADIMGWAKVALVPVTLEELTEEK